jgi:hypothetical protein
VDGKLVLSQTTQGKVIKSVRDTFHLGQYATQELISRLFVGIEIRSTVKQVCRGCSLCLYNNTGPKLLPLVEPIQR